MHVLFFHIQGLGIKSPWLTLISSYSRRVRKGSTTENKCSAPENGVKVAELSGGSTCTSPYLKSKMALPTSRSFSRNLAIPIKADIFEMTTTHNSSFQEVL